MIGCCPRRRRRGHLLGIAPSVGAAQKLELALGQVVRQGSISNVFGRTTEARRRRVCRGHGRNARDGRCPSAEAVAMQAMEALAARVEVAPLVARAVGGLATVVARIRAVAAVVAVGLPTR